MKEFIEKWLKEGLINPQQAKRMLADVEKESSEKSSKKIILTFSLIGAALVGAGFLLFISSNWQTIPSFCKVLMVAFITVACAFGGYQLEFENKKYPRTGASLLFLSAIMFGVLIFLTAQIYHIDSNRGMHILVLIWMLAILPLIYILQSRSIAALCCVLFTIWVTTFLFKFNDFNDFLKLMPLIYAVSGLFIYSFGKVNQFFSNGIKISNVFQNFGQFILYFCFFFITFTYFANPKESMVYDFLLTGQYSIVLRLMDLLLILSVIMFLPSFFFNPAKSRANNTESYLIAAFICVCVTLCGRNFIPQEYLRLFTNLFFAVMLLALIYTGYRKKETFYVNIGIFWMIIFIIVKYVDFFWKMLPRSLFFLAGGVLLVGAALLLEHKRRSINTEFKNGSGENL